MTRAVARVTTTALAVLAAALLSLALFAGPAAAADEGSEGGQAASSGVKGDATGLGYTVIAGVAVGVLVFAMSSPGEIHRADDHH